MKPRENKFIYRCGECMTPCHLVVGIGEGAPGYCPYNITVSSNFVCIGEEDIEFKRKNETILPEGYLNND